MIRKYKPDSLRVEYMIDSFFVLILSTNHPKRRVATEVLIQTTNPLSTSIPIRERCPFDITPWNHGPVLFVHSHSMLRHKRYSHRNPSSFPMLQSKRKSPD